MIAIKDHEGLVVTVAKRFRFLPGVTFDELLAAGRVGVWEAQRRFDPARGFSFSTYAMFWIRQCIGRWCYQSRLLVKVPIHVQERIGRARRAGGNVEARDLAGVLAQGTTSLHDEDAQILHDVAVLDPEPDDSELLHRTIDLLPEREAAVVRALYLDGARVNETASKLRISKATVSKIKRRALGRLRGLLEAAA